MGAKKPSKTRAEKRLEAMQYDLMLEQERLRRIEQARISRKEQALKTGQAGVVTTQTQGFVGFPLPNAQRAGSPVTSARSLSAKGGTGLLSAAKRIKP